MYINANWHCLKLVLAIAIQIKRITEFLSHQKFSFSHFSVDRDLEPETVLGLVLFSVSVCSLDCSVYFYKFVFQLMTNLSWFAVGDLLLDSK